MAEQFRTNPEYDPHRETAQLIFNKQDISDEQRQVGKVLNFSIQYGGGTPTIMRQLGCTYLEAKKYLDGYHATRPAVKKLTETLIVARAENGRNSLDRFGYIQNIYGRRGYVQDDHKMVNWLIQSTAADMMKAAMIAVDDYLTLLPWDTLESHMVNTVHDEIIFDAKDSEVDKLVRDVPLLMQEARVQEVVPIDVDVAISHTTWADKMEFV